MLKSSIKIAALVVFATALTVGLVAEQAKPAAGPTVTRTVLKQQDLPMAGMAAAMVRVDLPVGAREGRHRHPGTLIALVEEGTLTLEFEGKPTLTLKPGETFSVEPGQIHEGMNKGTVPVKLAATFVFPKDQPMTIQVPAK